MSSALLRGGGQERGRRAGTENVAAIAGFGAAARAALPGLAEEAGAASGVARRLRGAAAALAPDAVVFATGAPRLPNTLAFAIPGLAAATLLMRLDLEGVAVSSGSACSSGKVGAEPCAGGDGRRARAGGRRDPRQPRLGVERRRTSRPSRRAWRARLLEYDDRPDRRR